MSMETTAVIFRVDREGIIFALFPEFPSDNYGYLCTCYQHVGQHCSADYHGCIANSRLPPLLNTPTFSANWNSVATILKSSNVQPMPCTTNAVIGDAVSARIVPGYSLNPPLEKVRPVLRASRRASSVAFPAASSKGRTSIPAAPPIAALKAAAVARRLFTCGS